MRSPEEACSHCVSASLLPASESRSVEEAIGVDEMLQRFAGEFGPWQLRQFLLTSIAWALNAVHTMVVIFADKESTRSELCSAGIPDGEWAQSTVEEWRLGCGGGRYKIGLAQTAFFAGAMIGAGIFGHLSDSFLGRKGALTLASIFNTISSFLTAFSPSFSIYITLRFLTGLSTGGVGLTAFTLSIEPVGPSLRASLAISTFYFSSLGAISISITSLLLPSKSWRLLYISTSFPSLLFLIFAIPFISESPRWLLLRRNLPAAMTLIRSIAAVNSSSIPDNISLHYSHTPQLSSTSILRSPATRRRIFFAVLINLLGSVIYYGLTLNVGNLSTEVHFGVILNAVAEFPAYAVTGIAVRWCGRRRMAAGTMAVSGALCVVGGMVKEGRLGCAALGIFTAAAGFDVMFIYTAELFPTAVRNAALGWVTVAGQMGAMAAPMVVEAGKGKSSSVVFYVFGVCGVVAGMFSWGLPETLNKPMYETMGELEGGEEGFMPEKKSLSNVVV